MSQYLIILQAGKEGHEGLARVHHALLYCKDFQDNGHGAKLVFDGAGTEWVAELMKPEHKLHPLFKEVRDKGSIDAICDSCIGTFGADDAAQKRALTAAPESHAHPSIAKYVAEGYQILVL